MCHDVTTAAPHTRDNKGAQECRSSAQFGLVMSDSLLLTNISLNTRTVPLINKLFHPARAPLSLPASALFGRDVLPPLSRPTVCFNYGRISFQSPLFTVKTGQTVKRRPSLSSRHPGCLGCHGDRCHFVLFTPSYLPLPDQKISPKNTIN